MRHVIPILMALTVLLSSERLTAATLGSHDFTTEELSTTLDNATSTASPIAVTPAAYSLPRGQRLADIGRGFMVTGGTFIATGVALWGYSRIAYPHSDSDVETSTPMLPVFGAALGGLGALVALVGLPFSVSGKLMNNKSEVSLDMGGYDQRGLGLILEAGIGIPDMVSLDAVAGYNCNRNVFVGFGVGYREVIFKGDIHYEPLFPAYANLRLTLGQKRIAPYMSVRGGYDMQQGGYFGGLDIGTRIQPRNTEGENAAWWISSFTEGALTPSDYVMIGIKVGRTF